MEWGTKDLNGFADENVVNRRIGGVTLTGPAALLGCMVMETTCHRHRVTGPYVRLYCGSPDSTELTVANLKDSHNANKPSRTKEVQKWELRSGRT